MYEGNWFAVGYGQCKQDWIDPAMGQSLDKTAPYPLMYQESDSIDDAGVATPGMCEVFRATWPQQQVMDHLMILKFSTHGVHLLKNPTTVTKLWKNVVAAISENQRIEVMLWKNLPATKFSYMTRDITLMPKWQAKNGGTGVTFNSTDYRLGITRAMMNGKMPAVGYDLGKIDGFNHENIISKTGWSLFMTTITEAMAAADYRAVGKAIDTFNVPVSKATRKLASGYEYDKDPEGWDVYYGIGKKNQKKQLVKPDSKPDELWDTSSKDEKCISTVTLTAAVSSQWDTSSNPASHNAASSSSAMDPTFETWNSSNNWNIKDQKPITHWKKPGEWF